MGDRSSDELDILEIESKLRLRSFDDRPRFISSSKSIGDALRLADGAILLLPNEINKK